MEHWKCAKVQTIICSLDSTVISAIESLPILEKLNLNGNQFGDEGCEKLISQMGSSNNGHKLDTLDEDNEPDDDEDEERLQNEVTLSVSS